MDLLVNKVKHTVNVSPEENLLIVLRDYLDLTGSKYGCGEGACGACTVLIDGVPTRSCLKAVGKTVGTEITTIEGLESGGSLHNVQRAFLKHDVFQCSYCASGMIISAVALLNKNPQPSQTEIITGMQGNICRCGTYVRILKAIQDVSNS